MINQRNLHFRLQFLSKLYWIWREYSVIFLQFWFWRLLLYVFMEIRSGSHAISTIFSNPTKKLMPRKRSIVEVIRTWELYCVFKMGIFISVRWWCNSDCIPLQTFNKITSNIAYHTSAIGCHKGFISISLSNNAKFVHLIHCICMNNMKVFTMEGYHVIDWEIFIVISRSYILTFEMFGSCI